MVGFLRRHPDGHHAVECVRTRTYVDSTHFPRGRIRTYAYVRMWTPRVFRYLYFPAIGLCVRTHGGGLFLYFASGQVKNSARNGEEELQGEGSSTGKEL